MLLRLSVDQIRFYLNEEGERPSGAATVPRTSDTQIVACLVRAALEALRTDPQYLARGKTSADILALLPADGAEPDLDAEMPFDPTFVPEIEKQAVALVNLRDQPGYRPEVLDLIRNLVELSRPS